MDANTITIVATMVVLAITTLTLSFRQTAALSKQFAASVKELRSENRALSAKVDSKHSALSAKLDSSVSELRSEHRELTRDVADIRERIVRIETHLAHLSDFSSRAAPAPASTPDATPDSTPAADPDLESDDPPTAQPRSAR